MTRIRPFARGYKTFSSKEEAQFAYHTGKLHLQAPVKVRIDGEMVETTVGRTLFTISFQACLTYDDINKVLNKKELGKLLR
jgi:DNA-directed RNA polymerase subunit beta'